MTSSISFLSSVDWLMLVIKSLALTLIYFITRGSNMPLTFSNITNQKSVKISLGRGERNAVMLGVKFYVMDAEKWGEYIGEMVDTEDTIDEGGEVVKAPKRKFVDTLRSNKKAVLEVCTEVVVLSEDGLVIDLSVPETDGDGNPLKDEYDKPITRKVTAQLKKGDAMQGEVLDAFFSFVTTVQQIVEYYSKNVINIHQPDKKK